MEEDWHATEMARLDETHSAQLESIRAAQVNAEKAINTQLNGGSGA